MELDQPAPPLERRGVLRQQLKRLENRTHRDDSRLTMKSQLIAIVAAVLVVGCGPSVDIHQAAESGNIEAVKQHLAAGTDVNAKFANGTTLDGLTPLHLADTKEIVELLIAAGADVNAIIVSGRYKGKTSLDSAIRKNRPETADLLRKHGGKTKKELEAGN